MKKIKMMIAALLCGIAAFTACDKGEDPIVEEGIKIEGKWTIKEINFTSNVKQWGSNWVENQYELIPWAPSMFGSLSGVEFTNQDYIDSKTGISGKVYKQYNKSFGNSGTIYYVWNYSSDGKGFSVKQFNESMPPFDFSLTETSSLKEATIDGKRSLEFTTTVQSLDQAKKDVPYTDPFGRPKVTATATFTLVEATGEIDTNITPALKLNGQELIVPEVFTPTVTNENIAGKAWLLKNGSNLYDPGFSVQDPKYEFAKLMTLHFYREDSVKIRYSYPAGIIPTKQALRSFDEKTSLLSYVKEAGAMASNTQKFVWKASYALEDDTQYLVLDLQEVIDKYKTENEAKLDLSSVDQALFKRQFISVKPDDTEDDKIVKKDNYTIFK
mgnify:FL=1